MLIKCYLVLAVSMVIIACQEGRANATMQTRDIRTLSWEASSENLELLNHTCSKDMLTDWLIELTSFSVPEGIHSWFHGTKVIDYRFVDFNKEGMFELVMEVDTNTSGGAKPIEIIFRKGDKFVWREVPGWHPYGDLNSSIRDLGGDGRLEIITVERLSERIGYLPLIEYPAVYHVTVDNAERVDGQYPAFYTEFIDTCNTEIQKIKSANPSFGPRELEDATVQRIIPRVCFERKQRCPRQKGTCD